MSDSVSRRDRDDGSRHRHRSRSRDRRRRSEDKDSEGSSPSRRQASGSPRLEQSERRRHHRHSHSHKRPRRSLSPGEIVPEKPHHSRHHSHKRKAKHHDNEVREKSKSPVKTEEHVETPKSLESDSSDSDEVFGPMPAPESKYYDLKICIDISQQARSTRLRGKAEFGHDPKDIERYEQMGFVMSGNRKRRKVPQVTDDELRKSGFAVQKEVRDLKEKELVARFKELIETRKQHGDNS